MESREDLVKLIAGIWRNHCGLEELYKSLMSRDISRSFRRLCTNGHMSSLLCKKGVKVIYESFKCNLSDADLESFVSSADEVLRFADEPEAALEVIHAQQSLIAMYGILAARLWDDPEKASMCHDHQEQLRDLNRILSKHTAVYQRHTDLVHDAQVSY